MGGLFIISSLVSTKGATTALFATGVTMNEWAIIRGSSQTAGSYSLSTFGALGQKIAVIAGGAGLGFSFTQNLMHYSKGSISGSEFTGKIISDFAALRVGASSLSGLAAASIYGYTDIWYRSNKQGYQNAPGLIQMKRDIVDGVNQRYNKHNDWQRLAPPSNVNPWTLFPNNF